MAPEGSQIVILQRIMELDYDNVSDWAAHKAAVETDLMRRFELALPGVTGHIVSRQAASALTAWRFTLNFHGAMLGWEMSPQQLGDWRPGLEGPVRNLYVTGHWARPGGGVTPVIVSALDVAQAIIGRRGQGDTERLDVLMRASASTPSHRTTHD
jgi:phytoene dehydrogenase-like protein